MNQDNFSKFKELLKFVYENKYSDFYREKYKKAGFNPLKDFSSLEDIKKIPFTTKKELLKLNPFKLLFVKEEEVAFIFMTSGTTNIPLLIFGSEQWMECAAEEKMDWGRCLILFNPSITYGMSRNFKNKGALFRLVGDIHNLPPSLKAASRLGIKTIYTTPTLALILNSYLKDYPDIKKSLEFFLLAGESLNPYKKKLLKELYPDVKLFVASYSSADMGYMAFQCEYLAEREDCVYYHPMFYNYHFEIIDPETEKEAELGKKGELVLTNFTNPATPLIRYKTGDLVSLKENDCSCGFKGPLLEIWGRANRDVVRAGGFEIRTEMLEKSIYNLRDVIKEDFEVHIYENFVEGKPMIKLVLNLSLKDDIKEATALKETIDKEFLKNWQLSPRLNLKKAIEMGLFLPLEINFTEFSKSNKPRKALILKESD